MFLGLWNKFRRLAPQGLRDTDQRQELHPVSALFNVRPLALCHADSFGGFCLKHAKGDSFLPDSIRDLKP